ncbi:MAG: hypothetical protein GVY16_00090 [Planctomycetes bacterium]|nr:hypothetical protein [Planctomycetota bacterium]
MLVAGIDEAGLGPVLGPLVISSAAFRLDDADAEVDLWKCLKGAVSRTVSASRKRKAAAAVAIADSKALYNRHSKRGIEPLETAVLAMWTACRDGESVPQRLADLLGACGDGCLGRAATYPWYGECGLALPLKARVADVGFAVNSVRVAMRRAGVQPAGVRAEPIFVGEYNRLVGATHNKATAAFGVVAQLLAELGRHARKTGEQRLRVVVDRQGGRMRYREPLQRVFPDGRLRIVEESDDRSAYVIDSGGLSAEISFDVGGEERSLPTALASMLSKYLRECCMEMINGFWAGHVAGLKPTAGYHEDGNRFFDEIAEVVERLGIDRATVYRSR